MRQEAADVEAQGVEAQGVEALARAALDNGHAALLAQDNPTALRWLDRAHRLVPTDPNVMLALATARLHQDLAAAAELFQRVALRHDVAQAWFGVVACRFQLNDQAAAFEALGHLLSHFALTAETVDFVGRTVQGTPWCGLHSDGRLEVHADGPVRVVPIRVTLDGRAILDAVLPAMPADAPCVGIELTAMVENFHRSLSVGGVVALGAGRHWTRRSETAALERGLTSWSQPGFLTHAAALADLNLLAYALTRAELVPQSAAVFRTIALRSRRSTTKRPFPE